MVYANPTSLVEADWLEPRLRTPNVKVLDASWFMPESGRSARKEWLEDRIPESQFLDIELISDPAAPYPHTVVEPPVFSDEVTALGIEHNDQIVIYDRLGLYSAPRVWWMFKLYGYDKVAILNGGFPKWKAEGRPTESGRPEMPVPSFPFEVGFRPRLMRILPQMQENLKTGREQVVDARSPGRFKGEEEEPRPGVRPGHIPGSANVHYARLTDPETGALRGVDELRALFEEAGVTEDKPVVCTCGSGVTAAALAFALHLIGRDDVAVYDGSWSEWGAQEDTPVDTGG